MRNLLLLTSIVLFAACSDAPTENSGDSSVVDSAAVMSDTTLPHPMSTILDTVPTKDQALYSKMDPAAITDAMVKNTPEGWVIRDTMTGDLNRDQFTDLLIVLQRKNESESDSDLVRPLLILTGNPKTGGLDLRERNDDVVLCYHCGGVFGDPYDGLAIKNGYFSVEHYGGSSWRWTKIITFKYNADKNTWLLHRDGGTSYSVFDPDTEEESLVNQDHYGKMKFVEYNSN